MKTNSELSGTGYLPGSLSLSLSLPVQLTVHPFHLPPTSPGCPSSPRLLGTLTPVSIFNQPYVNSWSTELRVGLACQCLHIKEGQGQTHRCMEGQIDIVTCVGSIVRGSVPVSGKRHRKSRRTFQLASPPTSPKICLG